MAKKKQPVTVFSDPMVPLSEVHLPGWSVQSMLVPLSEVHLPPDWSIQSVLTPLSETIDWSHVFLGLTPEWYTADCSGVKVGVLDTGCVLHPDLKLADRFDFTGSRIGPDDQVRHGSWCCGFIGATANDIGVRGIAAGVKLYSLKVLGDNGSGTDRTIAAGLRKAIDLKLDIISMSFGGRGMSQECHELLRAFTKGGGFAFAAAGNDGRDGRGIPLPENDPAAWAEVMGIAAVDMDGRLTEFSCYDTGTTCAGPGYQMLSTVPNGYGLMSGTSMACPCVAGIAAKILAKHRNSGGDTPINSYLDMQDHIQKTATVKNDLKIINPMALFNEMKITPPPHNPGGVLSRIRFNVKTVDGETILIGLVE